MTITVSIEYTRCDGKQLRLYVPGMVGANLAELDEATRTAAVDRTIDDAKRIARQTADVVKHVLSLTEADRVVTVASALAAVRSRLGQLPVVDSPAVAQFTADVLRLDWKTCPETRVFWLMKRLGMKPPERTFASLMEAFIHRRVQLANGTYSYSVRHECRWMGTAGNGLVCSQCVRQRRRVSRRVCARGPIKGFKVCAHSGATPYRHALRPHALVRAAPPRLGQAR